MKVAGSLSRARAQLEEVRRNRLAPASLRASTSILGKVSKAAVGTVNDYWRVFQQNKAAGVLAVAGEVVPVFGAGTFSTHLLRASGIRAPGDQDTRPLLIAAARGVGDRVRLMKERAVRAYAVRRQGFQPQLSSAPAGSSSSFTRFGKAARLFSERRSAMRSVPQVLAAARMFSRRRQQFSFAGARL